MKTKRGWPAQSHYFVGRLLCVTWRLVATWAPRSVQLEIIVVTRIQIIHHHLNQNVCENQSRTADISISAKRLRVSSTKTIISWRSLKQQQQIIEKQPHSLDVASENRKKIQFVLLSLLLFVVSLLAGGADSYCSIIVNSTVGRIIATAIIFSNCEISDISWVLMIWT